MSEIRSPYGMLEWIILYCTDVIAIFKVLTFVLLKVEVLLDFNTLGTGYLNCLYAYKRKFASPVLNVLNCVSQ